MTVSNVFHCPKAEVSLRNFNSRASISRFPPSFVRFPRAVSWDRSVTCAAASATGSSNSDSELNPYEVLGVNPIEGFDMVKAVYAKKRKEAERNNDEATAARLEKAYDKLMMEQLSKRKKGVTFGSFKVSKEIKFADKQPIFPWGPRFAKSSPQDIRINLAISAAFVSGDMFRGFKFRKIVANIIENSADDEAQDDTIASKPTAWIAIKRYAEYKPLQFLAFAFVYRFFEKLKSFEPAVSPTYTEEGDDDGRALRMGKRLLRCLALVFGVIAVSSLAYTGILNLIEYAGGFIPAFLFDNQELIVTGSSAVLLFIMASYYR
ncbi:chloroplast J-like domain 1 [Citrus sinensis]|nr:chloroplast J-like domain 1 [Citrus sinensis]